MTKLKVCQQCCQIFSAKSTFKHCLLFFLLQVALTDLQVRVPPGTYGRVAPRSGLAAKHHIDVGAGVVDEDYTGNVGVVLFNLGDQEFKVFQRGIWGLFFSMVTSATGTDRKLLPTLPIIHLFNRVSAITSFPVRHQ